MLEIYQLQMKMSWSEFFSMRLATALYSQEENTNIVPSISLAEEAAVHTSI